MLPKKILFPLAAVVAVTNAVNWRFTLYELINPAGECTNVQGGQSGTGQVVCNAIDTPDEAMAYIGNTLVNGCTITLYSTANCAQGTAVGGVSVDPNIMLPCEWQPISNSGFNKKLKVPLVGD
jgi:hypothetical protein